MTQDRPGISPADDPYEFDWPDDAKDERAAERAAASAKAAVAPAPLLLSAIVLGLLTVLGFLLPVALVAGSLNFFIAMAAPIVIGGLTLALLPAWLLERVSVTWPRGLPELAFIVVGFIIGTCWSWLFLTVFDAPGAARIRGAVFMGTAVAAAFFAAHAWAEPFSRNRRIVRSLAAVIVVLTLASIANYLLFVLG